LPRAEPEPDAVPGQYEPTFAARRYLELDADEIQAAFKKWLRPDDLARVSEGPTPQ